MRVLIVEDSILMRELLAEALVEYGHSVLCAQDGAEAVELAEFESIDAVVSDFHMPRVNGLQLLSIFKEKWPNIPVIITTASTEIKQTQWLTFGAKYWFQKPINIEHLLKTLTTISKERL